jgi:HK97 family phage prohead protease
MESRTLLYEWDEYKVFEEIAPGAFDDVLNNDCRCLFNHNSSNVLGRTTNETLKLQVVDNELRFESVLPNTQTARDVYELVSRGDVNQCSFQFTIETEDRLEISPKEVVYRITKIKQLYDVGPVTFPAYQDTTVSARDIEKIKEELMNRDHAPVEKNKKWKNFLRLANTTQQ